jgi:hypothetical protein
MDGTVDDGLNESLVILETKWKQIEEKWLEKKEPLNEEEKQDLHTSLGLLQKQLTSLHAVKSLLKSLGQIRKKLSQVHAAAEQIKGKESAQKGYSLNIIDEEIVKVGHRRDEINKTLFEMYVDDFFVRNYMASIDDYRLTSQALPYGFVCHKEYQRQLDFFKTSISETEKDLKARREMLAETVEKDASEAIIASINSGMDHLRLLNSKVYQFLNETKPLNAQVFHKRCYALIQVSKHCGVFLLALITEHPNTDYLPLSLNSMKLLCCCCCLAEQEKMEVLEKIKRLQILRENELFKMY